MNLRLTVHVTNQPKVDTRAPIVTPQKKGVQKTAVDHAREEAAKNRNFKPKDKNATNDDNKGRYKVYTTLSSYHKTKEDCMKELKSIRSRYDIAIGNDRLKVNKYDKELYNISYVN